jgi:hypothetical protein
MAQLDFSSFVYQFVWFSFIFSVFYMILLKVIFPAISTALKARSKIVILDRKTIHSMISITKTNVSQQALLWEHSLVTQELQFKLFKTLQLGLLLKQSKIL